MKPTLLLLISLGLFFGFLSVFQTPRIGNATTPTPQPREPINLANIDRLELVHEIEFEDEITALEWVSEDNQLVVASGNKMIYFRDMNNFNIEDVLTTLLKACPPECITSLIFDQNTNLLIAGRRDGTLDVWNLQTLREEKIIITEATQIYSLESNPSTDYLVTGDVLGRVTVWNPENLESIAIQRNGSFISAVKISPNGEMIAFGGGWEPLLAIWRYPEDKILYFDTIQPDGINSVVFSQDNTKLVSGNWNGTIEVWDIASQERENIFTTQDSWITDLEVSLDNPVFFSASLEGGLRAWSWQKEELLLLDVDYAQWDIALNWDGTLLASGGQDKVLRIWAVAP